MSDLVGNPEDRFSRVAAHITWVCFRYVSPLDHAKPYAASFGCVVAINEIFLPWKDCISSSNLIFSLSQLKILFIQSHNYVDS